MPILYNSDFRSTRGLNTILKYIKSTKGAECGYAFGEGFAKDYILMVANTRVPSNTHLGFFKRFMHSGILDSNSAEVSNSRQQFDHISTELLSFTGVYS